MSPTISYDEIKNVLKNVLKNSDDYTYHVSKHLNESYQDEINKRIYLCVKDFEILSEKAITTKTNQNSPVYAFRDSPFFGSKVSGYLDIEFKKLKEK